MTKRSPGTVAEAHRASRTPALALAALIGYAAAFGVALVAWQVGDAERSEAAMVRTGNALAEDFARLAVEPMVRQDRIQLGLLARRNVERPEVGRIAIYTVDDRPFVDVGSSPVQAAPTYVRPIALEDTVLGYVRVTMDSAGFRLPLAQLLAGSWVMWVAGVVATFAAVLSRGLFVRWYQRLFAPARRLLSTRTPAVAREEVFLLVASLSHADAMASYARERVLRRSREAAERVADLYAAQVIELPDAGIAVAVNEAESADRGFEAVCAALLVRRLLDDMQRLGELETDSRGAIGGGRTDGPAALFGYGLDLASRDVDSDDPELFGEDGEAVRDIAHLAVLAPPAGVVVGQSAYAVLEGPERLQVETISGGATLTATGMIAGYLVRDAAGEYQGILARQAEQIAAAMR